MKALSSILFLMVLIFSNSVVSRADLAEPKNPKKANKTLNSTLEIVPDARATTARLQIRKSDLNQLRAALDETGTNQNLAASITGSAPRTIIAGLLIFLSLATAGILLVRSLRSAAVSRGQKTAAVIIVAAAVSLGAAAIVTRANVGPPPGLRWWDVPSALAKGESASGSVLIEIVADDQNSNAAMKLIIPYKKRTAADE